MALNNSTTTTFKENDSYNFSGLGGILKFNEPLAQHTSWHIGGNAQVYYRPKDLPDLINFIKQLPPSEQILFLGLGSNVLIRDGGFPGVVVHLFKALDDIQILNFDENNDTVDTVLLRIGAGVTCAKIAKFCAKNNLSGGEFFAGIPGTMGGALAMNAGAFGGETWNHVVNVDILTDFGDLITRNKSDYVVGYRNVIKKTINQELASTVKSLSIREWFVAGYLKFSKMSQNEITAANNSSLNNDNNENNDSNSNNNNRNLTIKQLLKQRNMTQPIGLLSCGSVFKNPTGMYAAKLIEAAKLKGIRVGNAEVSTKHANFIINLGNATASDVEELIELISLKVWQENKIKLEPEVKIIGIKFGEV